MYVNDDERYSNGRSKQLQADAGRRYREAQAQQREWVSALADSLGVKPQDLISHSAAAVAELMRTSYPPTAAE